MATTQNTYTGNGSTVLYSFTFPYLATTDIKVSVNGTNTTAYTLANATTIQFTAAPAIGAAIRIYRTTDDSQTKATFFAGSSIRAQNLNDNFTQNLYVTQEANNVASAATTTAAGAVTTANTALSQSATAISTANTASTNASAAVTTSNSASASAAAAVTTANTASTNASNAVTTANSAVTTANTKGDAAIASAASANTTAASAVTTANAATSTANTAATNAAAAVTTANTAASNASAAVSTANTASSNASTAVTTANTASTNASTAVTTANTANSKADQAISAVANSILYELVANVAAIPSSPTNNKAVEIVDSTGIQSFTPLAGRPSGFVGNSGLSVRIVYATAGSTWNWVQYFPNDPETRYLKLAGGTLTGALTLAANPSTALQAATKQYTDAADATLTTAASAAQTTANTGVTNAAAAQSTANTAVTNAATAQTTANTAVTNAAAAQTTANAAVVRAGDTMTGALGITAGTAAAPSLFVSGSTNTGLYSPGSGQLAISTNGTGKLFIDANGQVEVGTLLSGNSTIGIRIGKVASAGGTANNRLTLAAYGASHGAYIEGNGDYNSSTATNLIFGTQASGAAGGSQPVERMRLTSTGLGVGVSSPSYTLDVTSASNAFGINTQPATGTNISGIRANNSSGNLLIGIDSSTGGTFGSTTPYERAIYSSGAYPLRFYTNDALRLTIDSQGRCGIGTSGPAQLLEVQDGNIQIRNSAGLALGGVSANGLTFRNTNQVGQDRGTIAAIKSYLSTGSDNDFGIQFQTQATSISGVTTKMTLTPGGALGIGSTSPGSALDVNGAITARGDGSQVALYLGAGSQSIRDLGTASSTYLDLATGSASHGQFIVRSSNAYSERLRITSDGKLLVGTSSPPLGSPLLHVQGSQSTNGLANFANNTNTSDVNHGIINLINTATGAVGNDARIMFSFRQVGSSSGLDPMASIGAIKEAGTSAAAIQFNTRSSDAVYAERFRISSTGAQSSVIPGGSTLYPSFDCRAWVNWNGTGTVAIRGSGNVSSITDNGVGNYTVNFTTALADANYCVQVSSAFVTAADSINAPSSLTTSSVAVLHAENNAVADSTSMYVAIFR